MNDSFLEDLELLPTDVQNVKTHSIDRHITTRTATSSPLQQLQSTKGDNLHHKFEQATVVEKQTNAKEFTLKDTKKLLEHDTRKQQMKVRVSERRERISDSKLKPIENKVKPDDKEQEIKDDTKARVRETRVRISESKVTGRDRIRRSGSCKENNQASDLSVKENSRPSDPSKESTSQVEVPKDKTKTYESINKSAAKDSDPAALLNAIKDIVSMQTKQESSKILRAMHKLHFNAQANFIKHLMSQTDELVNEMHPSKDSSRVRSLVEHNERLKEDIVILQKRNEELQKKLEELEFLKQENLALKLKCKELLK
ncbi:PREDICTED: uncharacterized protein LOC107189574 [Dufourea novaeangliae]|uniref:uncharacterized protein LOC107189574 n=1 Tax=Dufourea novaeangliae TaxID=178035 RepID=UPI00076704F9|nr:PREDICTED: uncharacterized protein LOC107189574 [Dufourea novaeangliae]